jgi:hypothetical protein
VTDPVDPLLPLLVVAGAVALLPLGTFLLCAWGLWLEHRERMAGRGDDG